MNLYLSNSRALYLGQLDFLDVQKDSFCSSVCFAGGAGWGGDRSPHSKREFGQQMDFRLELQHYLFLGFQLFFYIDTDVDIHITVEIDIDKEQYTLLVLLLWRTLANTLELQVLGRKTPKLKCHSYPTILSVHAILMTYHH